MFGHCYLSFRGAGRNSRGFGSGSFIKRPNILDGRSASGRSDDSQYFFSSKNDFAFPNYLFLSNSNLLVCRRLFYLGSGEGSADRHDCFLQRVSSFYRDKAPYQEKAASRRSYGLKISCLVCIFIN